MTPLTSVQEILQRKIERWVDCAEVKQRDLLRLTLLRELIQDLHSEKSKCLATGNRAQAQEIKTIEVRIEGLRECQYLTGDLLSLIQNSDALPKKKRILPETLIRTLDQRQLDRYDRKWEASIAAEAISLNWTFWSLNAWIKIPLIDEWKQTFVEKLWPYGVVLFVENITSAQTLETNDESLFWRGNWIFVLDPNFPIPSDLSLNIHQWPGAIPTAPTLPQWKRFYP